MGAMPTCMKGTTDENLNVDLEVLEKAGRKKSDQQEGDDKEELEMKFDSLYNEIQISNEAVKVNGLINYCRNRRSGSSCQSLSTRSAKSWRFSKCDKTTMKHKTKRTTASGNFSICHFIGT